MQTDAYAEISAGQESEIRKRTGRKPFYIIPIMALLLGLLILAVCIQMNTPEKRIAKLMNLYARSYLECDTDAAIEIMAQCTIDDLKREWGEDGYREFIHSSLNYSHAECLDSHYGKNASIQFENLACKKMPASKMNELERAMKSKYHADIEIAESYWISGDMHISGADGSADLPIDKQIVMLRIGSRWSLFGATAERLVPAAEL